MKTIFVNMATLALAAGALSAQETGSDQPGQIELNAGTAGVVVGADSSPGNLVVVQTSTNGVARAAVSVNTGGGVRVGEAADPEVILQQVEDEVRASLRDASPEVREAQERALARMRQSFKNQRHTGSGYGYAQNLGLNTVPTPRGHVLATSFNRAGVPDSPALIVSRPMNANMRGEWQEDLRVMDKLLRDEVRRVGGDTSREAMGIRLWFDGQAHSPGAKPAYLEDYAVLFSYQVAFPLAGTTNAAPGRAERKTDSAWERARSEVRSKGVTEVNGVTKVYEYSQSGDGPSTAAAFDADKVEALINGLVQMLGEAKNIRHLKSDEFVIVTVSGSDDAGKPLRLTLKVSKADIDKLADGKLKPEEFRSKVAQNLG